MIGYFYIPTGQWSRGKDLHVGTLNGVWEMDERASQQDIYAKLFEAFCQRFGAPADGTSIVYYYAARNDA